MTKKRIGYILLIISILCLVHLIFIYSAYVNEVFILSEVSIRLLNSEIVDDNVKITIEIHNPLNRDIEVVGVKAAIYKSVEKALHALADIELFQTPLIVSANSTVTYTFKAHIIRGVILKEDTLYYSITVQLKTEYFGVIPYRLITFYTVR